MRHGKCHENLMVFQKTVMMLVIVCLGESRTPLFQPLATRLPSKTLIIWRVKMTLIRNGRSRWTPLWTQIFLGKEACLGQVQ